MPEPQQSREKHPTAECRKFAAAELRHAAKHTVFDVKASILNRADELDPEGATDD